MSFKTTVATMVRENLRERAQLCLWIGSLLAANVLGATGGLLLTVSHLVPNADDRALTLFLVGILNGWLLRMLWTAITGKKRKRRNRRTDR